MSLLLITILEIFFGDFRGCDSGMMAWLTVMKLLKSAGAPIHELIAESRALICCSSQVSFEVAKVEDAFRLLVRAYRKEYLVAAENDGIAFELPGDWRFTVRS